MTERESRVYAEPFRIANSRGSSPPSADSRETIDSVRPVADLMLGAAHADARFCEHEQEAVRSLLCRMLGTAELPEELRAHMAGFEPQSFDMTEAVQRFSERSQTSRRRLLEVVRSVCDADATFALEEERYMLDLVAALAVDPDQYRDLVVEEARGLNGPLKRALDVTLGSVAVLLLALPMLLIALGIKLTSRGPVLFKQKRYGRDGSEITVLKFRTMRVMDNGPQVRQVMRKDPRVTSFGSFLRRTSLDELPQFLNVVSGEMSLVGPRPHAVAHNEVYGKKIIEYALRHKIKPGITGWAQVNGWRGETDTLRKMVYRVEHDLEYIRRWSLWLDIKILWLTVFGRKVRQNAY